MIGRQTRFDQFGIKSKKIMKIVILGFIFDRMSNAFSSILEKNFKKSTNDDLEVRLECYLQYVSAMLGSQSDFSQIWDAFGLLFAIPVRYVVSKRRIDSNPTNVISADRQLTSNEQLTAKDPVQSNWTIPPPSYSPLWWVLFRKMFYFILFSRQR